MKLLDSITNKNNNTVEIWSSQLSFCPAFSLVLSTYAEIVGKELSIPVLHLKNSDLVIWAQYPDGVILGGICYTFDEDWSSAWIQLNFTAESSRGLGISSICHSYVEREAKNLGYSRIMSMVHVTNKSMLRSAEKVGLAPLFHVMHKSLK